MIIEFIGTPGAGKTTLVPAVLQYLQDACGMHPYTVIQASRVFAQRTVLGRLVSRLAPNSLRKPLLWQTFIFYSLAYRLNFAVHHPRLVTHVLHSQLRRPREAGVRQRRVLKWFFHLAGGYEFLASRAYPYEALVLDEGFVHRVVQMNASVVEKPDFDRIAAYVDLLPCPDIVIVPTAPLAVCEQRVLARGIWKPFQRHSPREISTYLAHSFQVVAMTTDYLKRKGWTVIEVDNGGSDFQGAYLELETKLERILSSPFQTAQAAGVKQTF